MRILARPRNAIEQFLRYALAAGFAAVLDTGLLYCLSIRFGVNHLVAAAAGFAVGLAANYLCCIAWVFDSSGRYREEFLLYTLIGLGGLAWTELFLWLSVDCAHLPLLLSKAGTILLVMLWNFTMRRKFIFVTASAKRT